MLCEMADLLKQTIIEKRGSNCFLSHMHTISDIWRKLDPGLPDDGTLCYISFNVPGKDRMKLKTNRFLVRKLGLKEKRILPDNEIQLLADKINELLFPDNTLQTRIDTGKAITDNYRQQIGGSSCMTGDDCDCTLMYELNPDIYSQLIMISGNNESRAMLIKLDNGSILMDRVYSNNDFLRDKMFTYAVKHGFLYREFTGPGPKDVIFPDNAVDDYASLVVTEVKYVRDCVPYADTLCDYQVLSNNTLRISHHKAGIPHDGKLDSTCGQLGCDDDYQTCDGCGFDELENDDCCSAENNDYVYCQDCFNDLFSYCNDCNETYPNDDMREVHNQQDQIEYVCEDCRNNSYNECVNCNDYHKTTSEHDGDDYCNSCFDEFIYVCEDCASTVHQDDIKNVGDKTVCESCFDLYSQCPECDEYVLSDDMTEHEDLFYCPDCFIEKQSILKEVI